MCYVLVFFMLRGPPLCTITDHHFPYTTLCRSHVDRRVRAVRRGRGPGGSTGLATGRRLSDTRRRSAQDGGRADHLPADGPGLGRRSAVEESSGRSEEHTSELMSLMRIPHAVNGLYITSTLRGLH